MSRKKGYFYKRLVSFKYAFQGIWYVVRHEANFSIHLVAALLVIVLGILLSISSTEWLILFLTIAGVLVAEVFNSAFEYFLDMQFPDKNEHVGRIKDMTAGAVLIMAIFAVVIGFIIFIPKFIELL